MTLVETLQACFQGNVNLSAAERGQLRATRAGGVPPRLVPALRQHKARVLELLAVGGGLPGAYALASLHDIYHWLNAARLWTEPHELVRERSPRMWTEQEAAELAWLEAAKRMRSGDEAAEGEMLDACERLYAAWVAIANMLGQERERNSSAGGDLHHAA